MDGQVVPIDAGSERQLIEHLDDGLVTLQVVVDHHLLAKIVRLSHFPSLMVPPEQVDLSGVLGLQSEEVRHDLWLVLAPVHVVSHEEDLGPSPTELLLSQHLHQVIELSMDVANNQYLPLDPHQVGLLAQNGSRLVHHRQKGLLGEEPARILVILDQLGVGYRASLHLF